MDDLNEKLAALLNDPQTLARVQQMAQNLLGEPEPPEEPSVTAPVSPPAADGFPAPAELQSMITLLSRLKNNQNDARSRFLLALRPLLSEPRQEKVDTALRLLRVIDLLPYLRDSGLLHL